MGVKIVGRLLTMIHRGYSKTVVDSSLSAQRYNPEFTVTTASSTASYGNTNTSVLIDQLRHINQKQQGKMKDPINVKNNVRNDVSTDINLPNIVQSQLALAPDGGTPLAEEAHDGSGSGDRPGWRNKDPSVKTNREFRPTLASSSMLMPSLSLILALGMLVA
ncbi:hypothetical protein HZH66_005129 [Vespula vulgaris]|uniref:Uncharacterized protein n=1 Tax=Vespula vulgaris TaxID=7454 RepID=A0A834KA09_VESVU|nr:hypothetical protein HZH66_005129 [Vespula vulgaris]